MVQETKLVAATDDEVNAFGGPHTPAYLLAQACATRGWSTPNWRVDGAEDGLYTACLTVQVDGQPREFHSIAAGYKTLALRDATIQALDRLVPDVSFPQEWRDLPQVRANAYDVLRNLCAELHLPAPSARFQFLESPLPAVLEIRIAGVDQVFIGRGTGKTEARAIAASQALAQLESSQPSAAEVAVARSAHVVPFGARTEPIGWLLDLCAAQGWSQPAYKLKASGAFPYQQWIATGTVAAHGVMVSATSPPMPNKGAAQRRAALEMIRKLDPSYPLPSELFEQPMEQLAMTNAIALAARLGLKGHEVTYETLDGELLKQWCEVRFKGLDRVWRAGAFSRQEAYAIAATRAKADLVALCEEKLKNRPTAPVAASVATKSAHKPVPQHNRWLWEMDEKLLSVRPYLGTDIRLSPRKADSEVWDLRLANGVTLTIASPRAGALELSRARDVAGKDVPIPVRIKGRTLSAEVSASVLAGSIRSLFVRAFEPTRREVPQANPNVEARLVATSLRRSAHPRVEADPYVKAAGLEFQRGFLAFGEGQDRHGGAAGNGFAEVDWMLGYDYAALCCAQCGASNSDGARCPVPQPVQPQDQAKSLPARLREAIDRLVGRPDARDPVQQCDAALIEEAARHLDALFPPEVRSAVLSPTYCHRCARLLEPARGVLCLTAGFALTEMNRVDGERAAGAPYREVHLYGLRRRAKSPEFWAYIVTTNGTIAQCGDPDIRAYRDSAEKVERAHLVEASLVLGPPKLLK